MHGCPICGSSGLREFFRKGERILLICRDCRHVWWDLFPPEEELRSYYSRQYTEAHGQQGIQAGAREYYAGHLRDLLTLIGKTAAETRICDYGCSIPVLLLEAKRIGFSEALGVDYCERTKQYGAENGVRVLLPDEAESLPDGCLDILRFSHTLEHSASPAGVLAATLRKVRRGGLVYITQPSFPVFGFAPSPRDLKDSVYPEHLHFFSPISLVELASRGGLAVHQFFTHHNEEAVVSAHQDHLDIEYAKERLTPYRGKGESAPHALGNYPYYAGENSVLYAFKAA